MKKRGATNMNDGVHILTGPIFVEEAEPGDVIAVEILDLEPRPNPEGRTFGSNAAAWWGFEYGMNGAAPPSWADEANKMEVATIYEVCRPAGRPRLGRRLTNFLTAGHQGRVGQDHLRQAGLLLQVRLQPHRAPLHRRRRRPAVRELYERRPRPGDPVRERHPELDGVLLARPPDQRPGHHHRVRRRPALQGPR